MLTFAIYSFDGSVVDWIVHRKKSDCYDHSLKTKQNVVRANNRSEKQFTNDLLTLQQKRAEFLECTK
ncbi:hypothetical protein ACFFHM_13555 [Halalkalibacter kiskunsagensis]|uniref:Uncharacterized protein n=1 Tax=Halalkalibacter kiskunsagensis TaxID=1548599 RepID=A0ABV6KDV6_9BACI